MKKKIAILILMLGICLFAFSQNKLADPVIRDPGRKFLTFNQAFVSLGFGANLQTAMGLGDLSTPLSNEDYYGDTVNTLGIGGFLSLNVLSPNSRIGFSLASNYTMGKLVFNTDEFYDKITYSKWESYLLLRFDLANNINVPLSFSLLAGPTFTIPINNLSDQYQIDIFEPYNYGIKTGLSFGYHFYEFIRVISFDIYYNHPLSNLITREYKQNMKINNMSFNNANVGFITAAIHVII